MNEEKKKENYYSIKKNRKYVYTKLLLQKKRNRYFTNKIKLIIIQRR